MLQNLEKRRIDRSVFGALAEAVASFFTFVSQPLGFIVALYLVDGGNLALSKAVFLEGFMGVMARGMRELF